MRTGKIKWYHHEKGFGFIGSENENDIFVHNSELKGQIPVKGDQVSYEIAENEKGPCAINVEVLKKNHHTKPG